MGKMHELLAVEGDLKSAALSALSDLKGLFTKGTGLLVGQVRKYRPFVEGGERQADEVTALATSVPDECERFALMFGRWINASIQKEVTNISTLADVIVDGEALLTGLPAPALLNLESKLASIRSVYENIPTLDPTEKWSWDAGRGCYLSPERTTYRTQKVMKSFIAAEATKEHPAQVQVFSEDQQVGEWTTIISTGAVTVTDKRGMIERIDKLLAAVKQARQRANSIEASNIMVAATLFEYIHVG